MIRAILMLIYIAIVIFKFEAYISPLQIKISTSILYAFIVLFFLKEAQFIESKK